MMATVTFANHRGSLPSVRGALRRSFGSTNVPGRLVPRCVAVRWTRKEYDEDELIQRYLALNPPKRRLPASDEVPCHWAQARPLTDKNGRKIWAMDEVWAQYWGDRRPPGHVYAEDVTNNEVDDYDEGFDEEEEEEEEDEIVQQPQQQRPCTSAPNGKEHFAKCK